VHAQKQDCLHIIGVALPVGGLTAVQIARPRRYRGTLGSGTVRLTRRGRTC
jgi:hypothetical protein